MRRRLGVLIAVLMSFAAYERPLRAQPYSFDDMIRAGIAACMNNHPGQPNVEAFCKCKVNTWLGLWDDNDRVTWSRTGVATEHMQQMELVAEKKCRGGGG